MCLSSSETSRCVAYTHRINAYESRTVQNRLLDKLPFVSIAELTKWAVCDRCSDIQSMAPSGSSIKRVVLIPSWDPQLAPYFTFSCFYITQGGIKWIKSIFIRKYSFCGLPVHVFRLGIFTYHSILSSIRVLTSWEARCTSFGNICKLYWIKAANMAVNSPKITYCYTQTSLTAYVYTQIISINHRGTYSCRDNDRICVYFLHVSTTLDHQGFHVTETSF